MANELMGGLNAPTAQRIAAAAVGAGGQALPMGAQIVLKVDQRSRRGLAGRLPVAQIPQHSCYFSHKEARPQCLCPFLTLGWVLPIL